MGYNSKVLIITKESDFNTYKETAKDVLDFNVVHKVTVNDKVMVGLYLDYTKWYEDYNWVAEAIEMLTTGDNAIAVIGEDLTDIEISPNFYEYDMFQIQPATFGIQTDETYIDECKF